MSTVILDSSIEAPKASSRFPVPTWLREPLLHFVLLGGVLFAADYFLASREDDPNRIVVDASVDAEAIKVFNDAREREPNAEELYAMRRVWLDNEVLYREGLALGLDKGDKAIRERVIFKALSVVDASVKLPPVDEQVLRSWFDKNRAKYDEPARFDFQEAVLTGDKSEARVREFAAKLNAGEPGDIDAGLRVFSGRPKANLEDSYGAQFVASLESSSPGEWRAIATKDGWRVIRVDAVVPAAPAEFDELGAVVMQDWTDAVMAEQRSAAVRALAQKYTVIVAEDVQ
jgi:hypothetical protein